MYLFRYVFYGILSLTFDVLLVLFFIRAILSWISPVPTNSFTVFIHTVTDFLIKPVRKLLSRFRFVRECPIDLSFTATVLLICIIRALLGL